MPDVFAASDKDAVKQLIENEVKKIKDITSGPCPYMGVRMVQLEYCCKSKLFAPSDDI